MDEDDLRYGSTSAADLAPPVSELPAGFTRIGYVDDRLSEVMHRIGGGQPRSGDQDLAWELIQARAELMLFSDTDEER